MSIIIFVIVKRISENLPYFSLIINHTERIAASCTMFIAASLVMSSFSFSDFLINSSAGHISLIFELILVVSFLVSFEDFWDLSFA